MIDSHKINSFFLVYLTIVTLIILAISCKSTNPSKKELGLENDTLISDSNKNINDVTDVKLENSKFDSLLIFFKSRENLFSKDTSYSNRLPNMLVSETLGKYASGETYALSLIKQNDIYCLIYLEECLAGGSCALYFASTFNSKGENISQLKLGMDASEYLSTERFEYRIIDSNIIESINVIIQFDEESEEETNRTEVKKKFKISDSGELLEL